MAQTSLTGTGRQHWLVAVTQGFAKQMYDKFLAGAEEHGGDLGDITTTRLINHVIEEANDTALYTAELKRRNTALPADALIDNDQYVVRYNKATCWAVLKWNEKERRFEDFDRGYLTVPYDGAVAYYLPT